MARKLPSLEEMLNSPLLDHVPVTEKSKTPLLPQEVRAFQEIIDFFNKHGRAPAADSSEINEKFLGIRLNTYRSRPEMRAMVLPYDSAGLLAASSVDIKKELPSLEEILASPLLGKADPSIYELKHVKPAAAEEPFSRAEKKECKDFWRFEKTFNDIASDIDARKVATKRFNQESQIAVGDFFILSGLICLVQSVLDEDNKTSRGKRNPRLRVIFDNRVEIDILKLSLARALYKDPNGRRVIPNKERLQEAMAGILPGDKPTGSVYFLASETLAPQLSAMKAAGRLIKIGCTSRSVQERISNAASDPTYLEAPVRLLAQMRCFNMNPQKFEYLIHAFLSQRRVNLTLIGKDGRAYRPHEWFEVDLETAMAAAEHIIDGTITNYRIDPLSGKIKQRL